METGNNTILITGGATGIGFALARRFVDAGSSVIICGRRQEALDEAKREFPSLTTFKCDLSIARERIALCEKISRSFPSLNVLINNAGIQARNPGLIEPQHWENHEAEISINLEAPIHLSLLFIPLLKKQSRAVIINVTSGLAFVPLAAAPTYSATKAALHSFTLSLRYQLSSTRIEVIEIAPPAVNTDLGGKGVHTFGVPLDEFADDTFKKLKEGDTLICHQFSENLARANPEEAEKIFLSMNEKFRA